MLKNNHNNYKITYLWTNKINKNIENKIMSCFNKTFAHKYNDSYFDWKFRKNPFGKSLHIFVMDKDRIISSRAFWRLDIDNLESYQCVDTAVLPTYQNRGIFKETILMAFKILKKKIIYNSPNKNSSPAYQKSGLKTIKDSNFTKVNFTSLMLKKAPTIKWDYKILKWRYEENPIITYYKLKKGNYFYIFRKIKSKFFLLVGKTKIKLNLTDVNPLICFSYDEVCKGLVIRTRQPWMIKGKVHSKFKSYLFDLT